MKRGQRLGEAAEPGGQLSFGAALVGVGVPAIDFSEGDLDAAVSFYGSDVPGHLDVLDRIDIPLQFHFGGSDPYIPRDQVARVEEAAAARANVEMHVEEDAGHAFHNRKAPMFYVPEPAARAWHRAEEFLRRHLPVAGKLPPAP